MSDAEGEGVLRTFLAIPPDGAWSEAARRLLEDLRRSLPDASWTRPETWHVTLRFLGDVPPPALARFEAAFAEAAAGLGAARLVHRGAAFFPRRGPARVAGVALEGEGSLPEIAAAAESCARGAGQAPEERPFRPHVTFARLRRPWPRAAVERFRGAVDSWTPPIWPVRDVVLYRSELRSEGAVHTAMARWELPAAQGAIA
jgi:2'-5' RNA ligase